MPPLHTPNAISNGKALSHLKKPDAPVATPRRIVQVVDWDNSRFDSDSGIWHWAYREIELVPRVCPTRPELPPPLFPTIRALLGFDLPATDTPGPTAPAASTSAPERAGNASAGVPPQPKILHPLQRPSQRPRMGIAHDEN